MKKTALSAALLCLAQSTLHADVPLIINYQGKVADSTGLPIGASGTAAAPVAAPVNRKVVFRIFDAATGGTRLWSEEQTATISLGVFSVLLGNGITATVSGVQESHDALDTIFTPSAATSRFLEIMVDNGDNTLNASDVAISPRQQITSTAFAFHAKVADGLAPASSTSTDLTISPATLPSGSLATNYGLGWYGTGRLFGGTAVDGPVLYGNSGGALGSNVSGTRTTALRWDANGRVGIGATSISSATNKLTLQGDMTTSPADQFTIRGNTDTNERINIGFDTTANNATLQSYTAASTTGPLLLNPSGGNVGIGTTSPGYKLDVAGTAQVTSTLTVGGAVTAPSFTGSGANLTAGTIPMAALVAAVQQSLCPPGSIMAYGGTTAPTGWLLCNGASVSRTTYATLYAAIGNNYGTADGSNFNLPDFRGRFLRGSTTDSNRDPNFSARVASNTGGNTGGNVGSYQADAFREHTHSYNDIYHSEGGGQVDLALFDGTNSKGSGDSDNDNDGYQILRTSGTTGGSETRPVNVTVNYIIKH